MGRYLKRYLLVLGSYSFSVPVTSLIHEIGHIITYLSLGITQFKLLLNPFTSSMAMPLVALPEEHIMYLASSGMIFQLAATVAIWAATKGNNSPYLTPVKILLPLSLLNIGGYLTAYNIPYGDSALMVQYGAPASLLVFMGVIAFILGVRILVKILPCLGFDSEDPFINSFLPLTMGFETYSIMMVLYALFTGNPLWIGWINMIFNVVLGSLLTVLFRRSSQEGYTPTMGEAYRVFGLGVLTVCLSYILKT